MIGHFHYDKRLEDAKFEDMRSTTHGICGSCDGTGAVCESYNEALTWTLCRHCVGRGFVGLLDAIGCLEHQEGY